MSIALLKVEIRFENDVVLARQRARQIAQLIGFDGQDQVRIATAVSEIARNAYQYARNARVEYTVKCADPREEVPCDWLWIHVNDNGPGIQELTRIMQGRYHSSTGMGLGIVGAQRLMDDFEIDSREGEGTCVRLGKRLPHNTPRITPKTISSMVNELARLAPQDAYGEIQKQNQELLSALAELEKRRAELVHLNRELEDTNRGVIALYAELDERADNLRRVSETKSRFLSNMTHEFRTPLNSILNFTRMLLDRIDGDLSAEQERQIQYIRKAGTELAELVDDLLDLAKVEAGKVIIRPTTFQVSDLFSTLRGMLRPLLTKADVNLLFDEPDVPVSLYTDESKLSQILRNFISNGLKFTESGEVRIQVKPEDEQLVTFSVSDTGVGIDPTNYEAVFADFVQIDGPHQRAVKGTGLGLPLTKKLAELLGGRVSLQSQLGHGSTFSVTVPRHYHGPSEVSAVPEVTQEIDPTRFPILVVEDNRETHYIYEKFLKGTGFQPIPAYSVKEALQALERFRPLAIVLDILLGPESGWSFLEAVKKQEALRSIPVYVVTLVNNRKKAASLGADDYHEKPLEREWLLTRLRSAAQSQRGSNVLVIDDDAMSRYTLRSYLRDPHFTVVEAYGGRSGLQLAQAIQPAFIMLDLEMPDLNGMEVLGELKSNPQTQAIPVAIYTSRDLTEEERMQITPLVHTILSKKTPLNSELLQSILRAVRTFNERHLQGA